MKRVALAAVAAAVFVRSADPLGAQLIEPVTRSTLTGPMLTVGGQVTSIQFENQSTRQAGSGVAAALAYGLNQTIAVVLLGSSAVVQYDSGAFVLTQAAVGARFHLTNTHRRWVPFLEIAMGPRRIRDDGARICNAFACTVGDLKRSGFVYAQSLGVSFYPVPQFAIVAAAHLNGGEFTKATLDGRETVGFETGAQDLRLSLGMTWAPRRGRR